MKRQQITSRQNAVFKSLLELLKSKGVREQGLALVAGRKIVPELIKTRPDQIRNFIISSNNPIDPGPLAQSCSTLELNADLFRELDSEGTDFPLITLQVKPPQLVEVLPPQALYLALSSPTNLGAAIRSGLAFGFREIVLLKEACSPYHAKCIRASAGSVFSANLWQGPSILDLPEDFPGIALDMHEGSTPLKQFEWPKMVSFIVGEEGRGLPRKFLNSVTIPISKEVESLNATVALSIALYAYYSRPL